MGALAFLPSIGVQRRVKTQEQSTYNTVRSSSAHLRVPHGRWAMNGWLRARGYTLPDPSSALDFCGIKLLSG